MRIAIDASFLVPGRVGGAEHMLTNLVEGLAATAKDDELLVLTDHPWEAPARVRWQPLRGPGNRFSRSWLTLRPLLDDVDAVLFSNYFTPPIRRTRRRPRFVTVIHDLQYRHYAANFSREKRAWLRATHMATLRLADVVVAISDDVRDDVLATYGRRWARRVRTVPNPVSWSRFGPAAPSNRPEADPPYVLAVAAQYPHKNLATLVRAFAALARRPGRDDVRLVLAGQLGRNLHGVAWYESIEDVVAESGAGDRVDVTGYVDDRRLGELYRGASVFCFPSLFEGFALPPVEALGFGLPVLTTRLTSIPEVTLGLATYLDDPLDVESMAERLGAMLDEPSRYAPSEEQALRVRETYAPSRIAERYLALLSR
jgi:glycosyltransferase involved in cell wall biosynthesis